MIYKKDVLMNSLIEKYGVNEPIFFSEIQSELPNLTRGRINQLIAETIEDGTLARFNDGVFYIPQNMIFGISKLDVRKVINKKYILYKDDVYGFYTGLQLLNIFGLTTQMPNIIEIITNNEATKKRKVVIGSQNIYVKKARTTITKDNFDALMVYEIFNLLSANDIKRADFNKLIDFIKVRGLTFNKLNKWSYCMPNRAVKNLLSSEVINVLA